MWKQLTMRRILHPFRADDGSDRASKATKYDGPFADLMAKLDQIPYQPLRKPVASS
ncbi:hypothetical protein WG907_15530 [Sphingobium sp. AN558]|uniref:hypothetical protein n=1 Tax=Sphingobium sp. AN558 TaxID=3133442 RepID=UPI0030BB2C3A